MINIKTKDVQISNTGIDFFIDKKWWFNKYPARGAAIYFRDGTVIYACTNFLKRKDYKKIDKLIQEIVNVANQPAKADIVMEDYVYQNHKLQGRTYYPKTSK